MHEQGHSNYYFSIVCFFITDIITFKHIVGMLNNAIKWIMNKIYILASK